MDFIFMLTRQDRTVADAETHLATALACGITHIGFKDVGRSMEDLHRLTAMIRDGGAVSVLEVVSDTRADELASIAAARALGVDIVMGGVHVADALDLLDGSALRYMPFPGRVSGSPSILHGPAEEIVASAAALAAQDHVAGLDLLAYRFDGDHPALMADVCKAAGGKPVIMAGSIDHPDRIRAARAAGAAGFTIGTAALDGAFPAEGRELAAQLAAIKASCAAA